MDELKLSIENLKRKLLRLIVLHDELFFHVSLELDNKYIQEIGMLQLEVNQKRLQCEKNKRLIQLVQNSIRNNEDYVLDNLQQQVQNEFEVFSDKINKQNTILTELPFVVDSATKRKAIEMYTILIALLHPSMNINEFENKQKLYAQAMLYFKQYDLMGLRTIKNRIKDSDIQETGDINILYDRKNDLELALNTYKRKINNLYGSYPFNKRYLLNNDKKIQEFRENLFKQLDSLEDSIEFLQERLASLIDVQYGNLL